MSGEDRGLPVTLTDTGDELEWSDGWPIVEWASDHAYLAFPREVALAMLSAIDAVRTDLAPLPEIRAALLRLDVERTAR